MVPRDEHRSLSPEHIFSGFSKLIYFCTYLRNVSPLQRLQHFGIVFFKIANLQWLGQVHWPKEYDNINPQRFG